MLNEEIGYLGDPERLVIYSFAAEAVRMINDAGRLVIVVTNQAGVARGLFTEDDVRRVNNVLLDHLTRAGARVDGIYYCPHHPEHGEPPYRVSCECRKPQPGMLLRAAREHGIDLGASWLITDRYREIPMAHGVGARGALVLTGFGQRDFDKLQHDWTQPPDLIAPDLIHAVTRILSAHGESTFSRFQPARGPL